MRPQTYFRPLPQTLSEKILQHPFQVGQPYPLPHTKPLHLMKKDPVRRIYLIAPIAAPRSNNFNRRFSVFQHPNLHRRGLRPQ